MIMRKKDNTYKQVGFKKVRQEDGTYKDVEYQYSRDSNGDYKLTFEKGFTREIEGELPLSLNGIGKDLKDYTIYGNIYQSDGVSPDTPQEVVGSGDRTGNLCEINGFDSGATEQKLLQTVILNAGTYTYSCVQNDTLTSNSRNCLMVRIGQAAHTYESTQQNYHLSAGKHTMTFTVIDDNTSVELRYWINTFSNICTFSEFMLNTGSIPLPYEPYGYKIPVSSDGETNSIYLGEVQTTRRINKLVLTGKEDFVKNDTGNPNNYLYYKTGYRANKYCYCTHLANMGALFASRIGIFNADYVLYFNFGATIMNAQPSGNTVTGLKEYLASQYAAGTPVKVYYVLENETTGIVNEPLMKLGDYADTVSMEQVGVQIPTIQGENIIDINTEVKPSNMYVKYKSSK